MRYINIHTITFYYKLCDYRMNETDKQLLTIKNPYERLTARVRRVRNRSLRNIMS